MKARAKPAGGPVTHVPGLDTPWPDARVWPVTRRLFAWWRWCWERGVDSVAARNALNSIRNRAAALRVEVVE